MKSFWEKRKELREILPIDLPEKMFENILSVRGMRIEGYLRPSI